MILTFEVNGEGYNANAILSAFIANHWLWRVNFDMYTHMVNHYIITFKVRGQGHNANALQVLNLTKGDCRLSYSNIIEDCKQWNHGL